MAKRDKKSKKKKKKDKRNSKEKARGGNLLVLVVDLYLAVPGVNFNF